MNKKYKTLRLLLGDQLNSAHCWFRTTDDSVLYVLMEVRTETDYVWHHIQKVCAFFAAMERFAGELSALGHQVIYLKLDDPENRQSFPENCDYLIEKYEISEFCYQLPDEYRLDSALSDYGRSLKVSYKAFDTEHFYTTRTELSEFFSGQKDFLMEPFYRYMRRKHGILMHEKDPAGGKWNFDDENRKKLPKSHKPTPPSLFENNVRSQHARITAAGITTIGRINPDNFYWPLDRKQSLKLLLHFTENCLPLFGTFQDAMAINEWSIYHSRLSFCLNTKMLAPREVITAALRACEKGATSVGMNQIEGFIRQILGWREYMRGMYWLKMPEFGELNFFGHRRKLPGWYWTGKTKMNCLKHCITGSLHHAYAHHIQRLMITGNFALLAGIDPDDVDRWYLGIYIDAIEWVEITNTRGMSQYADGGSIGSKPYTGSANYIHKMSNYCDSCSYNRSVRVGKNACPFNSLYWDFHFRHREKLERNSRLKMVYRIWDDMPLKERSDILLQAERYLERMEDL